MRPLEEYRVLAEAEVRRVNDADERAIPGTMLVLAFCDSLGQLMLFETGDRILGFVAWIRGNEEHIPLFQNRDFDAVRALPTEVLQQGAVLFVAETMTTETGLSARAARELSRLPGVTRICAFVEGGHPPVRRWRERKIRQKRALH